MLLHQLPQPVVRAMHPHLERGHRRARDPCNLLVRQSFHVLQHEDLALLRGQVLQRPLQCVRALHLLVRAVRPVGPRKHLVRRIERPFLSLPAAPPPVAAEGGPPQDRKSTRLNPPHGHISYAGFFLKKKKKMPPTASRPTSSSRSGTARRPH